MLKTFLLLSAAFSPLLFPQTASAFTQFSGGVCSSQGSWVESANRQMQVISSAIEALQNDPNCKAMMEEVGAVKMPPVEREEEGGSDVAQLATKYRELSSIAEPLNPKNFIAEGASAPGPELSQIKVIQQMSFRALMKETHDSLANLRSQANITQGPVTFSNVGPRLRAYLSKSKNAVRMANHSLLLGTKIMRALPKHNKCLHAQPNAGLSIMGAVADSAGALVSGGSLAGVGEFFTAIQEYQREMYYTNALKEMEVEKFNRAASCLVESTAESYCAVQDGEDTLNSLRPVSGRRRAEVQEALKSSDKELIASPLAGLLIYTEDMKVLQMWLRKVLFGAGDAQIGAQGNERNKAVGAYLGFVQTVTVLKTNLNEKEQRYHETTNGKDLDAKLGELKGIIDFLVGNLAEGREGAENFFLKSVKSEVEIPYRLLGVPIPDEVFSGQRMGFDTVWANWTRTPDQNITRDPDLLLQKVKNNLNNLIEKAQDAANAYYSTKMVEDPQNLVAEAFVGTNTTPYQALLHQRTYYKNLIDKLTKTIQATGGDSGKAIFREEMENVVPTLHDTVTRLEQVLGALQQAKKAAAGELTGDNSPGRKNQAIMRVVYQAASMLSSWDSFFGSRLQVALQADLKDTLMKGNAMTEAQRQYFLSVGPEIVGKLAGHFSSNPATERTDLNAAKVQHVANLEAVEKLFARVVFKSILSLSCKLDGGTACKFASNNQDPTNPDPWFRTNDSIVFLNKELAQEKKVTKEKSTGGWAYKLDKWLNPASEGSDAFRQTKAKLCVQALGFKSRETFKEICRGAVLKSEFTPENGSVELDVHFDKELEKIQKLVGTSGDANRFDKERRLGVCSLRSYLRRNHIYFLYNRTALSE